MRKPNQYNNKHLVGQQFFTRSCSKNQSLSVLLCFLRLKTLKFLFLSMRVIFVICPYSTKYTSANYHEQPPKNQNQSNLRTVCCKPEQKYFNVWEARVLPLLRVYSFLMIFCFIPEEVSMSFLAFLFSIMLFEESKLIKIVLILSRDRKKTAKIYLSSSSPVKKNRNLQKIFLSEHECSLQFFSMIKQSPFHRRWKYKVILARFFIRKFAWKWPGRLKIKQSLITIWYSFAYYRMKMRK